MIQIKAIHVEEFRGIRLLDLRLDGQSFVVAGPNGSGKEWRRRRDRLRANRLRCSTERRGHRWSQLGQTRPARAPTRQPCRRIGGTDDRGQREWPDRRADEVRETAATYKLEPDTPNCIPQWIGLPSIPS